MKFKTKPFRHQLELFNQTKDTESVALFWEQGCGKTKPTIDTAAHLYLKGEIDCLLVVAPNGVHRNWLTDELPVHLPEEATKDLLTFFYDSPKSGNIGFQKKMKQALNHKGLLVLTISYNGFMTKKGKAYIWKLFRHRECMVVLDESHFIKSPGAKRTISLLAASKYAKYKRILTGTPVAQGPFDVYSQVKFLQPTFWKERRFGSFAAFKQHFGIWRTAKEVLATEGYDPGYDQLVDYKNIEELNGYVSEVGFRLTKETAGLDLPPKLFSKRYFEMNSEQSRIYKELKEEYLTELAGGETLEASLAIVRMMRLQQITAGYVATEAGEPVTLVGKTNPRLELAESIGKNLPHQAIIWARFRKDIDQLMDIFGSDACRYDGNVCGDDRAKAKQAFQEGDKKFFIANPAAGSTGLTLTQAKTVIYYTNSFALVDRLQSEDRCHRIGQNAPVSYIDLICPGTIDEGIVKSLRNKYNLASQVTGDNLKEWI